MSFPSSFGPQVSAMLEVLVKAAVAEITKLAEEGAVELRLESLQKNSEIQELRRTLKVMEAQLCAAQEAARTRTRTTEDRQVQTESPSKDNEEDRDSFSRFLSLDPGHLVDGPRCRAEDSREVKPEPRDEPFSQTADNPAAVNICFTRDDLIWPPPACSLFEDVPAGMQEQQVVPSHAGAAGDAENMGVQIKEEVAVEDKTNSRAALDFDFGKEEPIWPPPACSELEESSVPAREQTQIFPSLTDQYAAHKSRNHTEGVRDDALRARSKNMVESRPVCVGGPTSEVHLFPHALNPNVRLEPCLQPPPQQPGPSLAFPHTLLQPTNAVGPFAEDHTLGRNSPRAKRPASVRRANQKAFTRPVCNKSFPRLSKLEAHQRSKAFTCLECGKSFTQRRRLRTHQSVHTGERPYSCKICGKTFSRQDNCFRHERFHSGVKPHKCGLCGKSFTVLSNLKMHEKLHWVDVR